MSIELEALIRNVIWLLLAPERRIDLQVAAVPNRTCKLGET